MLSFDRACMLVGRRALTLSCSHEFMLSSSSPHALLLSFPHALVQEGVGSCFVFLLDFAYLLLCSDSLPAPSSIPRESIRSLGNSLPILARTGFQNRAPVEAKRSLLKTKVSPKPRVSPKASKEAPRALREVLRELQTRSKSIKRCFKIA